jgi:hypothetical protein
MHGRGLGAHHRWTARLPNVSITHLETSHFRARAQQRLPLPTAAHVASMAADASEDEPRTPARDPLHMEKVASNGKDSAEQDSEEEDDDDADEEPKLKYNRLTSNLLPIYRNGDATSTFMVAGDKMVRHSSKLG